jgi:hypothetical protein
MDRTLIVFNGNKEIIKTSQIDVTWEEVRSLRNTQLADTDWWALKDLTMSQAKKDYRQALRDLPQDYPTANDAADNWPEVPE